MDFQTFVPSSDLFLKVGGVLLWGKLLAKLLISTIKWGHKEYARYRVWRRKWRRKLAAALDNPVGNPP